MDKDEFKAKFKRIMRQLDERNTKVSYKLKPDKYYQNKRKEFIELIDEGIKDGIFIMPASNTRIYKIYHDAWE